LLSSLEGAAITSIFIKGVQHEFQDIPNVKEDVTDLVLNIKKVRLRSYADRPVTVYLHVQGEGRVTAGDIKVPGTIEIVNPDLYLATLDNERADLDMELVVGTGRGFVPLEVQAEQNKEEQRIGVILVDAIYSPVVKVNSTVEALYRDRWDRLDKIVLEITTDGAISPDEALRQSADILRRQFFVLASQKYERDEPQKSTHLSHVLIPPSIYNRTLEDIGISFRAANALRRSGITTVGQVLTMGESDLTGIRNFGEKGLQNLCDCLWTKGCLPPTKE
jgi:DNA-directed RNA polymerase subunit alpha